jgi:hypothetical protein
MLAMNRRHLALILLALLAPSPALQGDKTKSGTPRPDFSGNWVLDHSRSNLGQLQRALGNTEVFLVVVHKDPELKMTRRANVGGREQVVMMTYYTDGRGEVNPRVIGGGEIKSKTKWDKAKVVSSSSTSFNGPRGETLYIDISEKRELSADGNTLTLTMSISSPQGVQVIKQVYSRAS